MERMYSNINEHLMWSVENIDVKGGAMMFDKETGNPIYKPNGLWNTLLKGQRDSYGGNGEGICARMSQMKENMAAAANEIRTGRKTYMWLVGRRALMMIKQDIVRAAKKDYNLIQGFSRDFYKTVGSMEPLMKTGEGATYLYKDLESGIVLGTQWAGFVDDYGDTHLLCHEPAFDSASNNKLWPKIDGVASASSATIALIDVSSYPNIKGQLVPNLLRLYYNGFDWIETVVTGAAMNLPTKWGSLGKMRSQTKATSTVTYAASCAAFISEPKFTGIIEYKI